MFIAIVPQIPVFVTLSSLFMQLSTLPTPFDSESFLSISSLAHPDPLSVFPAVIGIITLANVESSVWFRRDVLDQREKRHEKKVEERRNKGERLITLPSWTNLMRYGSLARIVVSLPMPGVCFPISLHPTRTPADVIP
jgi:mitochondrial inner membrane protein COX18